jgi:undecaprenyl-diphosphatase
MIPAIILLTAIAVATYVEEVLFQGSLAPSIDAFPGIISSWDIPVLIAINTSLANTYLGWVLSILTRFGSTAFMLAASVILYASGRRREGVLTFMAIVIGTLIALPLKMTLPRPRPYVVFPPAVLFDREAGSSFPSGHAMRSFAFAFLASKFWPRYRVAFYVFASLVAFSRVYLSQHYPSDVIVGMLIGLLVGYMTAKRESQIMTYSSRLGI